MDAYAGARMMCFLDPAREEEAVAIVTRLTDDLQGVTPQVGFSYYHGCGSKQNTLCESKRESSGRRRSGSFHNSKKNIFLVKDGCKKNIFEKFAQKP